MGVFMPKLNLAGTAWQDYDWEATAAGRIKLANLLAGELQQFGRLAGGSILLKSAAIAANATTIVCPGPGLFAGLVATGAGSSWTATVYDNTAGSGTVLVPSTAVALGKFTDAYIKPGELVQCDVGITVVTAGTTAGSLYALYVPGS